MTSLQDDYVEALQFITALADSLDEHTSFGGNSRDDSLIARARGFARAHRLDTPAPRPAPCGYGDASGGPCIARTGHPAGKHQDEHFPSAWHDCRTDDALAEPEPTEG